MATCKVVFKDGVPGRPKQEYSYLFNPLVDSLRIGDVVVVDSPRNGYVTANVVAILPEPQKNAMKWIVSKVNDIAYKARLKRENAAAEKYRKLRERVLEMPPEALEEIIRDYEDF